MIRVSDTGQEYIDEGEDGTLDAIIAALESLLSELLPQKNSQELDSL